MNLRTLAMIGIAVAALPVTRAGAEPVSDPAAIWTLQGENAKLAFGALTDHFYTNGLRVGWTSPAGDVPDFLRSLGRSLWGGGAQRVGLGVSQQIYTPCDTALVTPDPRDRPYAGILTANVTLLSDTADTRDLAVLSLGVVGPDAGAEPVQNGFHHLIGHANARGWEAQIPNTPAIEALSERTWRLPIATFAGLETDALPALTAGVGTVRDYVQAGVTLRLGQGLQSDFGVPRIRPGLSGEDAYVPTRPFAWYVFAGANGQAVGYDLLLQSAPFRSGPHVSPVWDVGEVQAGVAVIVHGVRLTAAYVAQTQEFEGQRGGLHQFASLSLSVRF
jgi:hypothetical protein